jgi:hypothetical protein
VNIRLATPETAPELTAYVGQLSRLDPRAVLRLTASASALGVFARPPFEVLVFRAFPLAGPTELDVTVPCTGFAVDADVVKPPPPVPTPPWAGVLPPRGGWTELARATTEDVVEQVRAGTDDFKARTEALAAAERAPAVLDRVAAEVWAQKALGPVTLRSAHAAVRLGFLTQGDEVVVRAAGPWLRLEGRHGLVFSRRPGAAALRLA